MAQLAGAGGICVCTELERQIRNAREARCEKFGSADLKNIKLPMELFRIVLPWETRAKATHSVTEVAKKTPLLAVAGVILLGSLLVAWWLMRHSGGYGQATTAATASIVATAPTNTRDKKSTS